MLIKRMADANRMVVVERAKVDQLMTSKTAMPVTG
jgi:hypothetical protein